MAGLRRRIERQSSVPKAFAGWESSVSSHNFPATIHPIPARAESRKPTRITVDRCGRDFFSGKSGASSTLMGGSPSPPEPWRVRIACSKPHKGTLALPLGGTDRNKSIPATAAFGWRKHLAGIKRGGIHAFSDAAHFAQLTLELIDAATSRTHTHVIIRILSFQSGKLTLGRNQLALLASRRLDRRFRLAFGCPLWRCGWKTGLNPGELVSRSSLIAFSFAQERPLRRADGGAQAVDQSLSSSSDVGSAISRARLGSLSVTLMACPLFLSSAISVRFSSILRGSR